MRKGASFNNFLDAIDGTYCTYEGGDDPNQDGIYPDPYGGGYEGPEDCGTAKPTNVISTSYAYNEADLSPFYTARQCSEYAKLGLMGVTVLYSSGDYGVAGNGGYCLTANGELSWYTCGEMPIFFMVRNLFLKRHDLQPQFPWNLPFHHVCWCHSSQPWVDCLRAGRCLRTSDLLWRRFQ